MRRVSRTRCSVLHDAPQSRDPKTHSIKLGPRISSPTPQERRAAQHPGHARLTPCRSRFNFQTATSRYAFPLPRRPAPEVLQRTRPKNRRAWGTPGARCTRSPVCKVESTRVLTADTPEHPAFPHAMVLTVSFVLSLVTGLDCHHRRRNRAPPKARLGKGTFRRLDASVGASGPHDFAVR